MKGERNRPRVFHILLSDALKIDPSPYGSVGKVFRGHGLEAAWVSKQDETIDPDWFSQPTVDLILVVQGKLRVDYDQSGWDSQILSSGDLLILPPHTRCRAYRWPRSIKKATVFLAVYPVKHSRRSRKTG